MIQVLDLEGGYPSQAVIKGIDFEVHKGEFFALLGPNGSGKTTLFKLITGVLCYTKGQVSIAGKPLHHYSSVEKARLLAVFSQEENISFDLTVEEIVSLGRYPHQQGLLKRLTKHDWQIVDEAMEAMDVAHYRDKLFKALSGGEKQRVLLAKALAQEPKILLMDEPTNHLDIYHTFQILNLLKEWQKTKGITIMAILHDLNVASLYADRIALLHQGRLKEVGDIHLLKKEAQLKEVYRVEVKSQSHPTIPKPQLFLTPQHGVEKETSVDFNRMYSIKQTDEWIHIEFTQPLRTISNGVVGEGLQWIKHFCNFHVDKFYNCSQPKRDIQQWLTARNLPVEQSLGMMTAVRLKDMALVQTKMGDYSFLVVVTAGVGNAVDISSQSTPQSTYQVGTINTMVFIDAHLTDGALVNAIISATEAKTKALVDLGIKDKGTQTLATGTSTDSLLIATSQVGEATPYAGSGTMIGKGIGQLVYKATQQAVRNYLKHLQSNSSLI